MKTADELEQELRSTGRTRIEYRPFGRTVDEAVELATKIIRRVYRNKTKRLHVIMRVIDLSDRDGYVLVAYAAVSRNKRRVEVF